MLASRFLFVLCTFSAAAVSSVSADSNDYKKYFLEPHEYCETYECRKGPSLLDPPIWDQEWQPFESSDLAVWGADVCLGYFLTKSESAWNGGTPDGKEGDHHGFYLVLGDFAARLHVFDWPYATEGSPYAGYGVYNCENTSWPELLLDGTRVEELKKWAEHRLSEANGWVGSIDGFEGSLKGSFRNETLGLTLRIENQGGMRISFRADYSGPPILIDETDGMY